jgi:hypothetical protein
VNTILRWREHLVRYLVERPAWNLSAGYSVGGLVMLGLLSGGIVVIPALVLLSIFMFVQWRMYDYTASVESLFSTYKMLAALEDKDKNND